MYPSSTDKSKNRGFAFVEYKSHKAAAMARRKLIPGAYVIYLIRLCLVCSCLSACCLWIHCVLSICAFYLCKLWSCAPWLYSRNLSAVGPARPSGLGRAREGCGRGSYAAGQSPLCKSVDDRVNEDTRLFFLICQSPETDVFFEGGDANIFSWDSNSANRCYPCRCWQCYPDSLHRIIIACFDCHYRKYFYISTHDMPLLLPYSFIQQQCNKCCWPSITPTIIVLGTIKIKHLSIM